MTETQEERKFEPIGERLKKLMQQYHLNMNSLSVRLGISSNSVITRIVKDPERGISLDYLQKILVTFPEVRAGLRFYAINKLISRVFCIVLPILLRTKIHISK